MAFGGQSASGNCNPRWMAAASFRASGGSSPLVAIRHPLECASRRPSRTGQLDDQIVPHELHGLADRGGPPRPRAAWNSSRTIASPRPSKTGVAPNPVTPSLRAAATARSTAATSAGPPRCSHMRPGRDRFRSAERSPSKSGRRNNGHHARRVFDLPPRQRAALPIGSGFMFRRRPADESGNQRAESGGILRPD